MPDLNKRYFILTLLSILVLIGGMLSTYVQELRVDAGQLRHFKLMELRDQFEDSCNDLTAMARNYVSTGEARYRRQHQEIRDIRDGRSPRPLGYGGTYWVLRGTEAPEELKTGKPTALLDLMRDGGYGPAEMSQLAEAKAASDNISQREGAIMATLSSDSSHAQRLLALEELFGQAYRNERAAVLLQISEAYGAAVLRTQAEIEQARTAWRLSEALTAGGLLLSLFFGGRLFRGVDRAGKSLHDAHRFSEAVFDTMGNVAVVLDRAGRIVRFNQAAELATGFSFKQVENQSIWEYLIPQEVRPAVRRVFENLTHDGMAGHYENQWLTKAGGRRMFSWHNTVLRDGSGRITHVIAIGEDVTERRANESELEKYRLNLEQLVAQRTQDLAQAHQDLKTTLAALEAGGLGTVKLGVDDGRVLYCNATMAARLGYSGEEMLSLHVWDFDPDYPPEVYRRTCQHIRDRGTVTFETCHLTRDRRSIPVEVVSCYQAAVGSQPAYLFAFSWDISGRKASEREHKEQQNRLELATRAAGLGIWAWDTRSNESVWDEALFDMYGVPVEDRVNPMPYSYWRGLVHPDDIDGVEKGMGDLLEGVGPYAAEFRILRPDGGTAYIDSAAYVEHDDDGAPVRMVGLNWDITQYRRQALRLQHALDDLKATQAAMDRVGIGVTWVDMQSARFIYANEAAAAMLGYGRDEILTLIVQDVAPDWDQERFLGMRERIRSEGIVHIEPEQLTKDGRRIPTAVSLYHQPAHGDLPEHYVAFIQDISTRKRDEALQIAAREAVESANRSMRQFVANMSHEIRTPINAVFGLLHLLGSTPLNDKQLGYIAKAKASADSLLGIIDEALDLAKLQAGKLVLAQEPFPLHELLQDLETVLGTLLHNKDVRYVIDLDPALPDRVVGDKQRLRQVCFNLISNATKFTSQGEITLSMKALRLAQDHVRVEFSVSDTGVGIPSELQQSVFEPFQQVDGSLTRAQGGTGLGLPICKMLVQRMGGEIKLASAPGEGTQVAVTLDLALDESSPTAPTSLDVYLAARGHVHRDVVQTPPGDMDKLDGLRILVVEDTLTFQDALRELLEMRGAHVDVADNGHMAVERVQAAVRPYDAVLMDIQMPIMDGYAATRLLRQTHDTTELPIFAMTAHVMPEDREASVAAGMNGHIAKPINIHHVVSLLLRYRKRDPVPTAQPAQHDASPAPVRAKNPPGFDLQAAMERLGNVGPIYLSLAKRYLESLDPAREALLQSLDRADLEMAARQLHTLRGSTLTVGAAELAESLAHMERTLQPRGESKTRQAPNSAMIGEPEALLSRTALTLEQIILDLGDVGGDAGAPASRPIDPAG